MATFPTTVPIEADPAKGRNGGMPPSPGGGDDGRSNPGSPEFAVRLRRARLGMAVAVSGVAMIFISLSSAYFVRQGLPSLDIRTGTLVHDWIPVPLPPLLLINTLVLLISSVTIELARRQSSLGRKTTNVNQISWLTVTIALGLAFLGGQLAAWRQLAATGFYLNTSPSSSFVYLLTGMHGIHLLGGILVLLFAGAVSVLLRSHPSQVVILDVTGWYWHFMAILWVYIFCLMKFAR